MTAEKLQRALPRQSCRLRLTVLALIAIESMARVIKKQRHVRLSGLDLRNFCRTNVRVLGAKVHHHRAARRLSGIRRNLPPVIANSSSRIEPRSRQPCQTTPKAKSQHANLQLAPLRSD